MTSDDDRKRIAKALERADAAQEGPWRHIPPNGVWLSSVQAFRAQQRQMICYNGLPENYEFIAHARTDVPILATLATRYMDETEALRARCARLGKLLNTPQTADFIEAVKAETAHQRARWGSAHDRSKSAENWYWLIGYLAGKALRASIDGDREKALHHTISSAAALAHWHDAIVNDPSNRGLGQDKDLAALKPGDLDNG